eukprot:scaffold5793_cov31-Phaeocystis_antarctica.AAC.1
MTTGGLTFFHFTQISPSPQQQSHGSECATHATWCVARPFAPLQITPGAIDMHKRRYALPAILARGQ